MTDTLRYEQTSLLAVCNGRLQAHIEPVMTTGCRVRTLNGSVGDVVRSYIETVDYARTEQPDIVFTNAPSWHASFARRFASHADSLTALAIRGDLWAEFDRMLSRRYRGNPGRRLDVRMRRRLANRNIEAIDHLIAVSDYIRGLIIAHTDVPEERISTVFPAIDTERFAPSDADPVELRAKLGVDVPHLVCAVTNFGFHDKIAGLSRFMPALHELVRRRDDVVVAVAGAGSYFDEFRQTHARELDHGRLRMLGYFKPVSDLYHAADVFAHFTLLDGIPNTAAEANACGLPVVANDFPSMFECIDDGVNGLIVPSELDIDETVGAIERLLDDPALRDQMGAAGRELVVSTRRPEVIGRRLMDILVPLAGER